MKKFLQISGVIFWIQILIIGGIAVNFQLKSSKYEEELVSFANSFDSDILSDRNWKASNRYFQIELTEDSDMSLFKEALNSFGVLEKCTFNLPIEVTLNTVSSESTAACIYERSEVKLYLSLERLEEGWLIVKTRIVSDAFKFSL
ncbi:hypothetical protein [Amphritea japonica]|uniref:hypothetical protein n=1 Tax=Amphritea japonica TaxID=452627 RepID=UPI00035C4C87|nr:hypothetical protein [Amphritea japonica]